MDTIGFVISQKEHENRRALIPEDICKIKNKKYLYFEVGYGKCLGYSDEEYIKAGANIVTREEALKQNIVCDPKIGDSEYLNCLSNQKIFGWIHAVQNRDITDKILNSNLTAYAWEDMFEKGRHVFWKNNEIAGEAAVSHAFQCVGDVPNNKKVALIGRGNVATGALKILISLGADVTIYNKHMESLLRDKIEEYDVIVNALLWDTTREDHIIYTSDLKRMKKNSRIIDISCDANGAVESSKPTTIENPIYEVNGVLHYVVDHTPSLVYKYASRGISEAVVKYIDDMIEGNENITLKNALIIEKGKIIDNRINIFQKR